MGYKFSSSPPETEVRRLDNLRQTYEIQAQRFSRLHDDVVVVTLLICILFITLGYLWVSGFVLLTGSLIIYLAKKRILSINRKISQVNHELHEICLRLLPQTKR